MGAYLSAAGLAIVAVARLSGRAARAHVANRRALLAAWLVVSMAGLAIAGCGTGQPSAPVAPLPTGPSPFTSSPWTALPTQSPTSPPPAPTPTGTLRWRGNVALPDRRLTPGAVFRGVTASQVCTPGWSEAHRDVPEEVRYAVFAEYGLRYSVHDAYEVDHLIPLALGGSNSIRNLWPQPEGGSRPGYPAKDRLEDRLHHLVCGGALRLRTAQHAIATNWWAAYKTYIGSTVPAQPASPAPPPAPAPAPSSSSGLPVVHPGAFCSLAGERGVTNLGTPMICKTTAIDSRLRWRAA